MVTKESNIKNHTVSSPSASAFTVYDSRCFRHNKPSSYLSNPSATYPKQDIFLMDDL